MDLSGGRRGLKGKVGDRPSGGREQRCLQTKGFLWWERI
jgi:hypothetical protein